MGCPRSSVGMRRYVQSSAEQRMGSALRSVRAPKQPRARRHRGRQRGGRGLAARAAQEAATPGVQQRPKPGRPAAGAWRRRLAARPRGGGGAARQAGGATHADIEAGPSKQCAARAVLEALPGNRNLSVVCPAMRASGEAVLCGGSFLLRTCVRCLRLACASNGREKRQRRCRRAARPRARGAQGYGFAGGVVL